jgi:hypothetical protein
VSQDFRKQTLEFIGELRAQAIFVRKDTPPHSILEALSFDPCPRAAVTVSGGASDFPPNLIGRITELFECIMPALSEHYQALFIDGGTHVGVMKILGEVLRHYQAFGSDLAPGTLAGPGVCRPLLVGFAPEPLVAYPGLSDGSGRPAQLDPNHAYFVLIREATSWGDEAESMFSFLDYLHRQKQLPVLSLIVNGGRITIQEAYQAAKQGRPIIVLEGTHRASELILAALDRAPEAELLALMTKLSIAASLEAMEEILRWLQTIAAHPKVTRFNLLTGQPEDLWHLIDRLLQTTVLQD